MDKELLIIALAVGGTVGLAGLARVLVPTLALILLVAAAIYLVASWTPIPDAVERLAILVDENWRLSLAGVGASVAGQLVHELLIRPRAA